LEIAADNIDKLINIEMRRTGLPRAGRQERRAVRLGGAGDSVDATRTQGDDLYRS
jgi:hypothetical protein